MKLDLEKLKADPRSQVAAPFDPPEPNAVPGPGGGTLDIEKLRASGLGPPEEDTWERYAQGGSFRPHMPVPMLPYYDAVMGKIENPKDFEVDMAASAYMGSLLKMNPDVVQRMLEPLAEEFFRQPMKPSQIVANALQDEEYIDDYMREWNNIQAAVRRAKEQGTWWDDVIMKAATKGTASVGSGIAGGIVGAKEKGRSVGRKALGVAALLTQMVGGQGIHVRLREQPPQELIDRWREAEMESSKLLWEMTKDPSLVMRRDDTASKFFAMIAETMPYITATTLASIGTGGWGGFFVGYMVEGNSAYQSALDAGVPEDKARRIGAAVGLVNALIETVGGKTTDKFFGLITDKITNRILAEGAEFAFGSFGELLEESGQEVSDIVGEGFYKDVPWKEAVRRVMLAGAAGAALGGTFHMGRTSIQIGLLAEGTLEQRRAVIRFRAAKDRAEKGMAKQQRGSLKQEVDDMRGLGAKMQEAQDAKEAEAAERGNRVVATEGAEAVDWKGNWEDTGKEGMAWEATVDGTEEGIVERDADGKVIGALRWKVDKSGTPYALIDDADPKLKETQLWVAEEHRRTGLGTKLANEAATLGIDVTEASPFTQAGASFVNARLATREAQEAQAASDATIVTEEESRQKPLETAVKVLGRDDVITQMGDKVRTLASTADERVASGKMNEEDKPAWIKKQLLAHGLKEDVDPEGVQIPGRNYWSESLGKFVAELSTNPDAKAGVDTVIEEVAAEPGLKRIYGKDTDLDAVEELTQLRKQVAEQTGDKAFADDSRSNLEWWSDFAIAYALAAKDERARLLRALAGKHAPNPARQAYDISSRLKGWLESMREIYHDLLRTAKRLRGYIDTGKIPVRAQEIVEEALGGAKKEA
ncbi:MAG TPA: GNAT family N-acetyltransferase, partial [Phycisphaerae bacterium]|nr:GNAT family N-acetyltransferase [Phycisphaerae bacterium]